MDCILAAFDFENNKLYFSAANNPLWLLRDGEIQEYKGDKMPVGKYSEEMKPFTLQSIPLQKGDLIYCITDGFADQFGGPKGKKFKYKPFMEILIANHKQPMELPKRILLKAFEEWKGELEQVDDVCVIGVLI